MKNKKYFVVSIVLLVLIFVVNTLLVLFNKTVLFDNYVYDVVRGLECSFFNNYFIYITKMGDVLTIIGVVILLALIFRNKHAIMFVSLAATSAFTNKIIKHIIRRERPSVLKLIEQGGYSYPSGHSMIAVSLYGYLLYLAFTKIKNGILRWVCCIILSILILSIGISRIYVGVHYASDVIGGFTLALIELILIIGLTKQHFRGK